MMTMFRTMNCRLKVGLFNPSYLLLFFPYSANSCELEVENAAVCVPSRILLTICHEGCSWSILAEVGTSVTSLTENFAFVDPYLIDALNIFFHYFFGIQHSKKN